MTFDAWWKANKYKFAQADFDRHGHEEVARAAWNMAVEIAITACNGQRDEDDSKDSQVWNGCIARCVADIKKAKA